MTEMTAIAITAPGGPEVLQPVKLARPVAGAGEILIRVRAAGVNRPDVMQRQGLYPPPPGAPLTPGLEVAGEVAVVGAQVRRWAVGDRVCALVTGGGYAEYCVAAADHALPVPPGLSFEQAGALPETYFTVWTNVFERGALKPGQTLLVHGGAGGIGTTAIQLAHAFGARVITTVGSAEKARVCEGLGAALAINYREQDFLAVLKDQKIAPDVILDVVGGDYVTRNIKAAAPDGRIINIAFQNGFKVEVDLMPLMLKRLTLTGSTLRPRSVAEKAAIARALEEKVWPLLAQGQCLPVVDRSFALAEAAAAHALMEASGHTGKIVLVP
jgi:NADPH2:quinone reductase